MHKFVQGDAAVLGKLGKCPLCGKHWNDPKQLLEHQAGQAHRQGCKALALAKKDVPWFAHVGSHIALPLLRTCGLPGSFEWRCTCQACNRSFQSIHAFHKHLREARATDCGDQHAKEVARIAQMCKTAEEEVKMLKLRGYSTQGRCYFEGCKNLAWHEVECDCLPLYKGVPRAMRFNACTEHLACPNCSQFLQNICVDAESICSYGACTPTTTCGNCDMHIDPPMPYLCGEVHVTSSAPGSCTDYQ